MRKRERLFSVLLAFVMIVTSMIQPSSVYATENTGEATTIQQETTAETTKTEETTTEKETENIKAEEKTTQEAEATTAAETITEEKTSKTAETTTAAEASTTGKATTATKEATVKQYASEAPTENKSNSPVVLSNEEEDSLTTELTSYTIGSGKDFSYTPTETGYFGLLSEQAGSITVSQEQEPLGTKSWDPEADMIKSLMWLSKGITYTLHIQGEETETMSLAFQPVTVSAGSFTTVDSCNYYYSTYMIRLKHETSLTLTLSNGQKYSVADEDWDLCSITLEYGYTVDEDGRLPKAGKNSVIADCHLEEKLSYPVSITSIADGVTEEITLDTEKEFSGIWDDEDCCAYIYFKIMVNETAKYRFKGSNIGQLELYQDTNKELKSVVPESGETEELFTCELEQGNTYVIYCEIQNTDSMGKLLISKVGIKDLKITKYKESYVEGIDAGKFGINVKYGLEFSITDESGNTRTYSYDEWMYKNELVIKVDGEIWNRSLDSVANKAGSHQLTIGYFGAEDTVTFTVQPFAEYVKDKTILKEGSNVLQVKNDVDNEFVFTPQKDGYYSITSNADFTSASIYDASGQVCSLIYENERTTFLSGGQSYILNAYFYRKGVGNGNNMNLEIMISRGMDIQSIEVITPPKQTYIYPFDTVDLVDLTANMKFKITYVNGSMEEVRYDEGIPMSYECDWDYLSSDSIGTYSLKISSKDPHFTDLTYPISVISVEKAEEQGLIQSLSVESEQEIPESLVYDATYYKLSGISQGKNYFIVNPVEIGDGDEMRLSLYNKEGEVCSAEVLDYQGGSMVASLDNTTEYYLALKSYSEEAQWKLLVTQKEVRTVSIEKEPTKKSFYTFEIPDLTGMELNVTYSTGESETVPYKSYMWYAYFDWQMDREEGKWVIRITDQKDSVTYGTFECTMKSLSEYPNLISLKKGTMYTVNLDEENNYAVFAFNPSTTDEYTFTSYGNKDTYTSLYDGDSQSYLVADDDSGEATNFQLQTQLIKGKTYYYVVKFNYRGNTGTFHVLLTDEKAEHDHVYSDWVVTTKPTCTEKGEETRTCIVCGKVEKRNETGALGHSFSAWTQTAPTCTENGKKTRTCTKCGKTETVSIPAVGHSFGEYKVTKQPTALATGTKTRTCTKCGKTESAAIAKLNPIIALSATKLPLQLKKSTTVLKVTKMQTGDKVASFTSSNSKIVTVHKTSGKLTAKKAGKATITVKLKSGKSAKCIVTVQKTPVKTTKIQVKPSSLKLKKGKKVKLVTVLTPLTSQEKVTFTSSNKKIATVSSSGVVTAKKAGKVKITAKSGKKKVTCRITVTAK